MSNMIDFCAYFDYNVKIKNEYCYIDEEGEHRKGVSNCEKQMCGGELADFIAKKITDAYFCQLSVINANTLYISLFRPDDGTDKNFTITIIDKK